MASRLDELDAVVAAVVAACRAAGAGEQPCRFTIPLVVTEVLANAIERGNGNDAARRVHVSLRRAHRRLLLEVRDEGSGFDLSACRGTPGLTAVREAEGGRGLFIVCALTEHVESMSTPAGGLVRVTFKPS
jgi:anti-sigma regulatory factor (Ser/Thr protein kinase)